MNGGWPIIQLSECCDIVSGSTPRREIAEYWHGDIPWVTPKDISKLDGAKVLEDAPEYITEAGYKACSTTMLPKGTVLFSSRAPIGLVAVAGRAMCTNQGFKSFVPHKNVSSDYLYHCMKWMAPSIAAMGNGATFKEVSKTTMERVSIPLPPLKEQQRLAAIMDKADSICRKRAETISLLDELLGSTFLDMFGDPVNNHRCWPLKALGDVCSVQLGKMLSSKSKTGVNSKKYLRNANIRWRHIDFSDVLEMDFSPVEQKKFSLKNGDLLVCEGGEVGRCAIWEKENQEYYYQKALHRIRVEKKLICPEYLQEYLYWMSLLGGLIKASSEVTFSHLTAEKIKTLQVPVPPIELQKKFIGKYNKILAIRNKLNNLLDQNNNLFQSVVQRAFKGEL